MDGAGVGSSPSRCETQTRPAAPAPPLSMHDRRDESLARWCREAWQTHEGRPRHPGYRETWPSTAVFKGRWPALAHLLIVAAWKIERAESPAEFEEIAYDLLDPPPEPVRDWRDTYAEELASSPKLAWALADENPIANVIRRARLSPLEAEAFRLWTAGASLSSTARVLGCQKRAVATLLDRADFKVRELVGMPEEVAS